MNFFQKKHIYILCLASLCGLISSCTNASEKECESDNINQNLSCLLKSNDSLKEQLINKGNSKERDFKKWEKEIQKKCEGKVTHIAGEGAGLVRSQCYRDEYLSRLAFLTTGKTLKEEKNIHGLIVTYLPYNSADHFKCILKKNINSCSKVNLVSSSNLIKFYPTISPSYGDGVVLPETESGKQIIISPFEDNEDEGPQLAILSINTFGIEEKKFIPATKNVLIDKNYNLTYMEGNKEKRIQLK